MLAPGDRFEGFVVDGMLGRGGSATVYRAHDAAGDRTVALKILHVERRDAADLARLRREYRFASELTHPHVVAMYAAGATWLAMQFVDGVPLTTVATMAHRLAALGQIADALDHCHRRGVVHCDVKPANILVHRDFDAGGAVLIDFGAAHSTAEEVKRHPTRVEASLPYAAPEMLTGRTPTAAVDEYALACTAFEAITGAPPFTATTSMGLIDQHLRRPPPRASRRIAWIPHAFDSIIAKALAKSPDRRYESCSELVRLLTRTLR